MDFYFTILSGERSMIKKCYHNDNIRYTDLTWPNDEFFFYYKWTTIILGIQIWLDQMIDFFLFFLLQVMFELSTYSSKRNLILFWQWDKTRRLLHVLFFLSKRHQLLHLLLLTFSKQKFRNSAFIHQLLHLLDKGNLEGKPQYLCLHGTLIGCQVRHGGCWSTKTGQRSSPKSKSRYGVSPSPRSPI